MSKLSIDELLAKAENKQKKKRCENHPGVLRYIERCNITAGTLAVPTHVIFYHYRSIYDGVADINKARKVTFFRTFSKRFPQYRKNKQRFYLLNDDFIQITEELLRTAKLYDKTYWNPKKKKRVRLSGQEGNDSDET